MATKKGRYAEKEIVKIYIIKKMWVTPHRIEI